MALKIRLRRQGRTNRPFYRLVVMECHTPRDGKYVESLGWYDPMIQDKNFEIASERVDFWLQNGAILTDKAESLVLRAAPDVMKAQREKIAQKKEKLRLKKKTSKS